MSKYTPEVQEIFKTTAAPHRGLLVDIVEFADHLTIVVYRGNVAEFSTPQQQDLAMYLIGMAEKIKKLGIPCLLEVRDGPSDSVGAR